MHKIAEIKNIPYFLPVMYIHYHTCHFSSNNSAMARINISRVVETSTHSKHFYRWGALTTIMAVYIVACSSACIDPLYITLRRGFYCDNNVSVILQDMLLYHCKLVCRRGLCAGLSYNFAAKTCFINSKPCVNASLHPDYELILFQPSRPYPCIRWVDSPPLRYVTKDYQGVARNKRGNQWVPGKHLLINRLTCTA